MKNREEVRGLLRRHQDALNRHDVEGLMALYAADAVLLSPMFDTVEGCDAIRRSYERLFTVFPDYTIEMRDALFLHEGERAAEFSTVTGTHRVELYGLPPTGQQIKYHAARLFTIHDGLIVYEQRIYDFGGVLERLEKSRLERELGLASLVQRTLLSRTTHSGAFFEIAGSSLPCRTIGGDFLEYVDLASGSVGVALGDVSGKGPAAALVAAMVQGMFSIVVDDHPDPSDTLSRLNRAMRRRNIEPAYATLTYGILSPEGRLTYSNAGHHPPVLLSAGRVTLLTAGGPMLGIFEDAQFPQESIDLAPGDILISFSDGLTDATAPDGLDYGIDRLLASLAAIDPAGPNELLEAVFALVKNFCGDELPVDDVTVVVTRFLGARAFGPATTR